MHACIIFIQKTPDYALQKTLEKYLVNLRNNSPMQTRDAVLEALSDMLVMAPVMQTVHYHAQTPKNTYFYVFGHHTASESQTKVSIDVSAINLVHISSKRELITYITR